MAAPTGNKFWLKRAKHGRDKILADPKAMLEAAYEYFEYEYKRVWNKPEAIKVGEFAGQLVDVPIHNPFTMQGLCIFLDLNTRYFEQFEKAQKKVIDNQEDTENLTTEQIKNITEKKELAKDFSTVISRIKDIIDKQKIDGATVGAYNASLVSQLIGLTTKTQAELTGKNGGPIEVVKQITGIIVE